MVRPGPSNKTGARYGDNFVEYDLKLMLGLEQNTLNAKSTNGIVNLNLSLDQKLHLLTSGISQFWNKSNICYTAFDLHEYTFMAPRQQIMMTTKSLDRMRLCFKTKVRFSDVLLVSHRIIQRTITQYKIRQRMQNIFKFIFMLNWST